MRRIQWKTIRAPGRALGRWFLDDAGWLGRAPAGFKHAVNKHVYYCEHGSYGMAGSVQLHSCDVVGPYFMLR